MSKKAPTSDPKKAVRGQAVKKFCTCASEQQDAMHGNGVRIHNTTKDGVRCTVCGVKK